MNDIQMEGIPNTEVLTQIWREKLTEHYVDKPRFHSLLKISPLNFKITEEVLRIYFEVRNEPQKQWIELKMLSELTSHFAYYSGIDNVEIIPVVNEEDDKNIIDDYPHFPIPPENLEIKQLVRDLELDIK
jgi:hypothetical protein